MLISVILIAIAGTLTPSKVTGTLPGSVESHFNILRSHDSIRFDSIQDPKLPSHSLSRPDAASSNRIDTRPRELRSSGSDLPIPTVQNSENSGTRADPAGAVSLVHEGLQTVLRGDGHNEKEIGYNETRPAMGDTKVDESGRRETEEGGLSKGAPLISDEPSRSRSTAEMARETKQHGRTSHVHRHLEPHNLTGFTSSFFHFFLASSSIPYTYR